MKNSFQSFKNLELNTLRKNSTMHSHAITVMYSIGSLVDNLDDGEQLVLLVAKIVHNHVARGTGLKYFQVCTSTFVLKVIFSIKESFNSSFLQMSILS